MNKYVIIGIIFVLIIVAGSVYRAKFLPESEKPIVTGIEKSLSIVTFEDTWKFEPEYLEVDQGDKITLTITNNDDYDHGFAIDAFGVSQRMPANETITIEFIVTKAGDFPYYCSVSCGSGIVDGVERGHFDQVGRIHVRSLISETSGLAPEKSDEDFAREARESAFIAPANERVEELGYDVESLDILFDNENSLWETFQESEDTSADLPEEGYQSILYRDNGSRPVLWVFVDKSDGEVLSVLEIE